MRGQCPFAFAINFSKAWLTFAGFPCRRRAMVLSQSKVLPQSEISEKWECLT
jgi:hypothetical protein